MENVSPNIFVRDIKSTVEFYKTMGFEIATVFPEDGEPVFVMMTSGKVTFMFQTFDSLGDDLPEISRLNGGSLLFYVSISDIKKYYEDIKDKVNVLKGLEKTFYGATEFSVLDNNGYVITFGEQEK